MNGRTGCALRSSVVAPDVQLLLLSFPPQLSLVRLPDIVLKHSLPRRFQDPPSTTQMPSGGWTSARVGFHSQRW